MASSFRGGVDKPKQDKGWRKVSQKNQQELKSTVKKIYIRIIIEKAIHWFLCRKH